MARFLHTADWQLGKAPHFLSDEARARFSAARVDVIGRIDGDPTVLAGAAEGASIMVRRLEAPRG